MKKIIISAAFLLCAFTPIKPSGVYGEDNRRDLFELENPAVKELANSTAAMISNSSIQAIDANTYKVKAEVIGKKYGFCPDERFFNQPTVADCSATLVAPDVLLTAGHCMGPGECDANTFVFGYAMKSAQDFPQTFAAKDVYRCVKVIDREWSETVDYALVKLDRPVSDRKPVAMAKSDAIKDDAVFAIGYPSGLPVKVADHARVKRQDYGYFVANLDTFAGNSGSAVFSERSHAIVGILVRGGADYVTDTERNCKKVYRCPDEGCYGEEVTNISEVNKRFLEH